jgi:predicted HAD superfamily Cof-like phosphohydrolase
LNGKPSIPGDNFVSDIKTFHEAFNQVYDGPPRALPEEYAWRTKFMREELKEYNDAVKEGDLVKQFDALLDLAYVVFGTLYLQGLPTQEGWAEIQRSNMSKECVPAGEGKFGATVHKGMTYTPPDLVKILKAAFGKHGEHYEPTGDR